MGKIVAIGNWKSLLGKTTTAINLSAVLALRGFKVLLIDTDTRAQSTAVLGKIDSQNIHTCMINAEGLINVIKATNITNLDLLPAHPDLDHIETGMLDVDHKEQRLKLLLTGVKDNYDFIFIDCPAAPNLMTFNAFTAADTLLIPLQCEYIALDNLAKLLRLLQTIQARLNPDLKLEGILITLYDKNSNSSNQIVYTLKSYFKTLIFETIIPKISIPFEAKNSNPLFIKDHIDSKVGLGYLKFAHEFLERTKK